MNILLKAFDGPSNHLAIERALRDIDVGTCISVLWALHEVPTINAKEHLAWDARKFRWAEYTDADWEGVAPLDAKLIEDMRACEGLFMAMITRNSLYEIPYAVRKETYYKHLRYWNHILETKKIDCMLLNHVPHQSYDLVIYDLCRIKKIPTIIVYRIDPLGVEFLIENYEDSSLEVRDAFKKLKEEYSDPAKPVALTPRMERYFEGQTKHDAAPWNMYARPSYLTQKNFIRKWSGIAAQMFARKPLQFLSYVMSPKFWARKLREHRTIAFYDNHTIQPDFTVPYVYLALHMQPEATTSPIGGAFVDQELMVKLLSAHLPAGVLLYVKEHPHQRESMRSPAFYQTMLDCPNVRFVPRTTSTVTLSKNAAAVATVTGTAGFETLFRCIPVMIFGHIYYQYASGVYKIRSGEDCRRAVEEIFVKKRKPTLQDIRLYLKAIESCTSTYDCAPQGPDEHQTEAEQNIEWGAFMAERLKKLAK